jgi:hypothetical protein
MSSESTSSIPTKYPSGHLARERMNRTDPESVEGAQRSSAAQAPSTLSSRGEKSLLDESACFLPQAAPAIWRSAGAPGCPLEELCGGAGNDKQRLRKGCAHAAQARASPHKVPHARAGPEGGTPPLPPIAATEHNPPEESSFVTDFHTLVTNAPRPGTSGDDKTCHLTRETITRAGCRPPKTALLSVSLAWHQVCCCSNR